MNKIYQSLLIVLLLSVTSYAVPKNDLTYIYYGDTKVEITDSGTDGTIDFTADGVNQCTMDTNGVTANQMNLGTITFGEDIDVREGTAAGGQHLMVKHHDADSATRSYIAPNGSPAGDVTAALKIFSDDYEADALNYRDFGLYWDKNDGHNGAGALYLNSKIGGDYWGWFPDINMSFQDGSRIPLRAMYVNTTAEPLTPYVGYWQTGKVYAIGDYISSGVGPVYVAASNGTSGATKPVHLAGTVSDGGVDWTFVFDQSTQAGNYEAFIQIGKKTDEFLYGTTWKDHTLRLSQDSLIHYGASLDFMNSAKDEADVKIFRSIDDLELAAPDPDGKVALTGKVRSSSTLSKASGDEIAYTMSYETNKAAGNDFGLVISQTDTASPANSFLIQAQVDTVAKFKVNNAGDTTARLYYTDAGYLRTTLPGTALNLNDLTQTAALTNVRVAPTYTNTSGNSYMFSIVPTYNQASGSGNNTDLFINRTETAIMTGTQLLIDAQVGTFSKYTLGTKGKGVYNTTLELATGDEAALTLNYTTNKTVSGNDTGLKISMLDTASPGTSKLIDAYVGGAPTFNTDNAGNTNMAGYATVVKVTSDPCGTYPEGAIFYNNTSDYYCFCNGAGDDVQMHSPGTACF